MSEGGRAAKSFITSYSVLRSNFSVPMPDPLSRTAARDDLNRPQLSATRPVILSANLPHSHANKRGHILSHNHFDRFFNLYLGHVKLNMTGKPRHKLVLSSNAQNSKKATTLPACVCPHACVALDRIPCMCLVFACLHDAQLGREGEREGETDREKRGGLEGEMETVECGKSGRCKNAL